MRTAFEAVVIALGGAITVYAVGAVTICVGVAGEAIHLIRSAKRGEYSERDRELLALAADGTWPLMKTIVGTGVAWPVALIREIREAEEK